MSAFQRARRGRPAAWVCLCLCVLASAAGGAEDQGPALAPPRLEFLPGRELVYRVVIDKCVMREGDKHPYHSRSECLLWSKVQSVGTGTSIEATLQYRFDQVRWSASAGMDATEFDSAAEPRPSDPPEFEKVRAMIKRPFLVKLSDRGQIMFLRTLDPRVALADMDSGLTQMVGEQQLRAILTSLYSWLPPEAVAPGAAWEREEELPLGLLNLIRKNQVRVTGGTLDHPIIQSTMVLVEKPGQGVEQEGVRVEARLESAKPGQAEIHFDRTRGVLESMRSSVALEMSVHTRPVTGKKPKATVVRHALEATSEATLVSVDGAAPLAN